MKWVMRTGFVRVASSEGDRIYRSLEELPDGLREKARAALEGPNADTILIADPEAYERIVNSDEELPAGLQRFRTSANAERPGEGPSTSGADHQWKVILGIGIVAIVSLWAIWLWAVRSSMQ